MEVEFEKANDVINEIRTLDYELRLVCESVGAHATGEEGVLSDVVLKLLGATMVEVNKIDDEIMEVCSKKCQAEKRELEEKKAAAEAEYEAWLIKNYPERLDKWMAIKKGKPAKTPGPKKANLADMDIDGTA